MTDLETRLSTALADTARRNLPDGTTPQPFRRPEDSNAAARRPGARIRPWAIPALVAAVVVAFAVGVVVLTNRGQDNRTASGNGPAGGTFVTLRARAPLSAAELAKARQIISARAAGLGAANADVQIVGSNEITAFLPGVAAKDVGDLVAVAALEFRPLIVNQTWRASGTSGSSAGDRRVVDPWKSLGFAPPKDAAGYQALNRTQQNAIQAVIRKWDCRNAPPDLPGAPIVACDSGRTAKYLLGPAIVTGDQIKTATAVSPGAVTGQFAMDDQCRPDSRRAARVDHLHRTAQRAGASRR